MALTVSDEHVVTVPNAPPGHEDCVRQAFEAGKAIGRAEMADEIADLIEEAMSCNTQPHSIVEDALDLAQGNRGPNLYLAIRQLTAQRLQGEGVRMFVLTLKPGEWVTVGPDIRLTTKIVRRQGKRQVRVVFDAPIEIRIDREQGEVRRG